VIDTPIALQSIHLLLQPCKRTSLGPEAFFDPYLIADEHLDQNEGVCLADRRLSAKARRATNAAEQTGITEVSFEERFRLAGCTPFVEFKI
jgi:hypothetical protein